MTEDLYAVERALDIIRCPAGSTLYVSYGQFRIYLPQLTCNPSKLWNEVC